MEPHLKLHPSRRPAYRLAQCAAPLLAALLLAGCIHPANTVAYDRDIHSPTDFAQRLMIRLASPDHRLPKKPTVKHSADHTLHVLDATFWPAANLDEMDYEFRHYCESLKGDYHDGLCSYDGGRAAHFYVQLTPTGPHDDNSAELRMIVTEALVAPGWSVLTIAEQHGYVTPQAVQAQQIKETLRDPQAASPTP